jgi:hypothetical protein
MSDTTFGGGRGRNYLCGFEGSQAVPICPSDMGKVYNQIFFFNMTLEGLLYCKV